MNKYGGEGGTKNIVNLDRETRCFGIYNRIISIFPDR